MDFFKELIKSVGFSFLAMLAWLIIELPLMYFLVGVLGSNPYVFAIPAILGFLVMFCIERYFVGNERVTSKEFVIYVYVVPEIIIILISIIALSSARGNNESFSYSLGSLLQYGAVLVAVTIALRVMSFATQKFINKMEKNN